MTKSNTFKKHLSFFYLFLGTLLLPVLIPGFFSPLEAEEGSAWRTANIIDVTKQEHRPRGIWIHTTDSDELGAAFRCEKGSLFAHLSTKPIDFKKKLNEGSQRNRVREVRLSIDGGVERTEDWIQMYGGQIYLVKEIPTTAEIFKTAATGGAITFTRKYKDAVTVSLPEGYEDKFIDFVVDCKLKFKYRFNTVD